LRSRSSRREESLEDGSGESVPHHAAGERDPESEAVLADSVGLACSSCSIPCRPPSVSPSCSTIGSARHSTTSRRSSDDRRRRRGARV